MININKYIVMSGYCSRRAADILIKSGKVKINNKTAKILDKVSDFDIVVIDNKKIKINSKKIYLAFNKPKGVICTTDKNSFNTIMDYIRLNERVYPVGRLDVNSEGLILLTNDGALTQKILKDKIIEKEYSVKVHKKITIDFLKKLERGIMIDGRLTLPCKTKQIDDQSFQIILREGRKRQIRRMCEKNHYEVINLKRIRIGKIKVDGIESGKYLELCEKNIYNLLGY